MALRKIQFLINQYREAEVDIPDDIPDEDYVTYIIHQYGNDLYGAPTILSEQIDWDTVDVK